MFIRERHLRQIRPFYELTDLIKVLTGVRRCGKSVLLGQIADELREQNPDATVVEINLELTEFSGLSSAEKLVDHVLAEIGGRAAGTAYVLLDEAQLVPGFERAVNSLRARGGISVFITGSNASLFSQELSTQLAGRYVDFRIWPFTFAESLELRGIAAADSTPALMEDYLTWGGLPLRFALPGDAERRTYLDDVFSSVVLRDVVQRTGIRDIALLTGIVDFLIENLGRVMSPRSLAGFLANQGRKVSAETIYSYLRALSDALLFNRVRRWDVRGKHVLANLDKYYATDLGVVASKHVGAGPGRGDIVENVVFAELAARGFELYTGKTTRGEIDFVAIRDAEPRYVQVTYLLATEEITAREFGAFSPVTDNYPKFVISTDTFTRNRDGIVHLGLDRFLLDPPTELA